MMKLRDEAIHITTPYWWDAFRLRQNRVITFAEEICSGTTLSEAIIAMALESDRPILILMHSPGGSVLEGLGIYDTIMAVRAHGVKVIIHAIGPLASMAAIVIQAADVRVMTPNSRMLLHEIREFIFMDSKTVSDAVDQAKELKILNDRLASLVADRSDALTPATLKQMWRKDWWLWPEEALELGLIDKIALVDLT